MNNKWVIFFTGSSACMFLGVAEQEEATVSW